MCFITTYNINCNWRRCDKSNRKILWIFFVILGKRFFMKKFLDKHILIEVLLDELLMPILILYLANFNLQFLLYGEVIRKSKFCLILVMSYIISWIVEVARKVIDNIPDWFVVAYTGFDKERKIIIEEAKNEIENKLKEFSDDDYFAIRSSAGNEDSAENSFAGQFDTFLYVKKTEVVQI